MSTLRSKEVEDKYTNYKKNKTEDCAICRLEPLHSFKYWKIIENEYPYDLIAEKHHMIASFRHVDENGLSIEEKEELSEIKNDFLAKGKYNFLFEAIGNTKTIPAHFHLHLIELKSQDKIWRDLQK